MRSSNCYCGLPMKVREFPAYPIPGGDGELMAKPADWAECVIPGHFQGWLLMNDKVEHPPLSLPLARRLLRNTIGRFSVVRERASG